MKLPDSTFKKPRYSTIQRTLLSTLIATLAFGTTYAEEETLEIIAVTASPLLDARLPTATEVDEEALQSRKSATSDTSALLRDVPGVSIHNAGGVSSLPAIHGLADDRLRIKVDGMDLISACGNHMNAPLSYIDPSSAASAQVFAGITPVSVGGDSIGGTILVDSAEPKFAQPGEGVLTSGAAGLSYRSNGNILSGNVAATAASESVSLTYRGSTTSGDNYDAGGAFKDAAYIAGVTIDDEDQILDADEVGSTMFKSTNQSIALALRNENHQVELKVGIQDIPYQGWPNQRMDMTGNDSTQINLNYDGNYSWGTLEARTYHEHTEHSMQFYDDKLYWYPSGDSSCIPSGGNSGCAAGMPMDTEGKNTGVVLKANIPLSERDLLRVGTEMQQYRLDDWWDPSGRGMWPETFWNINNGERDRLAAFGEWEAQWNSRWLTQLGMRYERVGYATSTSAAPWNTMIAPKYTGEADAFNSADRSRTDDNIDLTALARFTPGDNLAVEFGYGRKSRSPNLYERYTWSTNGMSMRMINWAGDGNGYVGNLDLEPEVAHTISATFDWQDAAADKWGFKATPYYTYVDDYIDARRCDSSDSGVTSGSACTDANADPANTTAFVYLKFVNQSASLYGVDLSGYYRLADNTAYGDFTAKGLLNYVRGKNETTGDNLYGIMPLNAKIALEQNKGNWTNTIEVELVADKDDVSAERNELETDSYNLFHLRSSYQWRQVRLDFGIENLFDKLYNHPLGGAYLGEGKTMSGGDVPWGVAVPGEGRSFYAGVNIEF
jgi:iron complex outermembrane receptor protein